MNASPLAIIAALGLAAIAATFIIPWLVSHRDDEAIGTHEEWTGGDTTNWKGRDDG